MRLWCAVFRNFSRSAIEVEEAIGRHHRGFALLSGSDMAAARALGPLIGWTKLPWRSSSLPRIQKKPQGKGTICYWFPAVFLIAGAEGLIEFEYVNPDYRVRPQSRLAPCCPDGSL